MGEGARRGRTPLGWTDEELTCRLCGRSFTDYDTMVVHVVAVHIEGRPDPTAPPPPRGRWRRRR